jgi:hypothetical protein
MRPGWTAFTWRRRRTVDDAGAAMAAAATMVGRGDEDGTGDRGIALIGAVLATDLPAVVAAAAVADPAPNRSPRPARRGGTRRADAAAAAVAAAITAAKVVGAQVAAAVVKGVAIISWLLEYVDIISV